MITHRRCRLASTLLVTLSSLAASAAPPTGKGAAPAAASLLTLDVEAGVVAAARSLGPGVVFFTSKARPLATLAEIRDPAREAGTGDFSLARELMGVLRAGGVKLGGGAMDLMRLVSEHHFSALFLEHKELRFFATLVRPDGSERAIIDRGGGVRVIFRARDRHDLVAGADAGEAKPAAAPARDPKQPFVTSFGPLLGAELTTTARHRRFDPQEGAQVESRQARRGRAFLVLHIDRDFSAGLGTVSFLFGSGVMLKPEFGGLVITNGAGKRQPLSATYDEGRTLDLAYELPANARGLTLKDGDKEVSLGDLLTKGPSARASAD